MPELDNNLIAIYPDRSELMLGQRPLLHPLFQSLPEGISEFTFAGLYLFRESHQYRIARLDERQYIITGDDGDDRRFFMLPFGLPGRDVLEQLLDEEGFMRCASESQAKLLGEMGYRVEEDRDNFDYLYLREDLTELRGNKYHKKKNLVNAFIRNHEYEGRPLLPEYRQAAIDVLDQWRAGRDNDGDYRGAREALEQMEHLQLCGGIYFVDHEPVAYTIGEENALGRSYVIHSEKAIRVGEFKGIYQFVNQSFASILPEHYETINREQDLGDPGLRKAKESYRPIGFVKKYRIMKPA